MPHATVPSPGLQALILCGPGVSLNTFTSNPNDLPKALIPIANRPMVWYPLDWCYRMGVTDITLITPPESAPPLEAALATNPALTGLPSPKPEILAPADLTQTTGTGELLRLPEVQKCIASDFVVLPCDVISELDGTKLLQQWITLNPLPTNSTSGKRKGGMAVFYPTHGLEGISTKKDETDFLATVPITPPTVPAPRTSLRTHIEEVVLNMPTDTLNDKVEEGQGFLRLRQSLMEKHGRVKMRMKHRDASIYIFPKWVMEFAAKHEKFDSISEDLLGWWAKAGWQEGLAQKLALDIVLGWKKVRFENGENEEDENEEIDVEALSSTKTTPVANSASTPAFASRVKDAAVNKPEIERRLPPLLAYVQPAPSQPLVRRVDTTAQLLAVSLYLAKQPLEHVLAHEQKISPSATLEQQARVSQEDSLIGENVKLGFRSNVKESVIGANCEIGKNVRLTKCLLMEGVIVGDGVQMMGCIIGRRARIEGMKPTEQGAASSAGEGLAEGAGKGKKKKAGDDDEERTKLTDCEVAPNFVVDAGTEAKGEKMMGFHTDNLDGESDDSTEGRNDGEE
jgi:translation initiation factor eIF-2B subunit gamma